MNSRRILSLARRVILQVLHDRRTLVLIVVGPLIILNLLAILFRSTAPAIPLGVVNEDLGITSPVGGTINLGQRIADELAAGDTFTLVTLDRDAVDDSLRDGSVQAVIVFPEDFTTHFLQDRQAVLDLRLEGSDPTRSQVISIQVTQAAMRSLAGLAAGTAMGVSPIAQAGEGTLPVTLHATYLYGGQEFDAMDYVAPVYIAFLGMFFVFLLACVAFLRERSQGTMERLAATPATRTDIVLGYMIGLGLFALIQVAVILFYTVWALKIHYLGSLGLLFLVIALMAVAGVTMGILASAFARTEFQVIQFIPLVIFPQALLGGLFWPVTDLPAYLQPFAYLMPLYYANTAMRDVMLKGWGLAEIWPNLAILVGFIAVLIVLSALMMKREVA
jgi:ABC-2 type transport system permease protein